MKPTFLIGTQPNGLPVAINVDMIRYVVAYDNALTMVHMFDGEKVTITETVDEFVNSVNDL